jgi:hypothetical protein
VRVGLTLQVPREDAAQQVDRLEDHRVAQGVEDGGRLAASRDQTLFTQDCQVRGN